MTDGEIVEALAWRAEALRPLLLARGTLAKARMADNHVEAAAYLDQADAHLEHLALIMKRAVAGDLSPTAVLDQAAQQSA